MTENEIVQFLKDNLRLEVEWRGGCPEERTPADLYLILKIGEEEIQRVWVDL